MYEMIEYKPWGMGFWALMFCFNQFLSCFEHNENMVHFSEYPQHEDNFLNIYFIK